MPRKYDNNFKSMIVNLIVNEKHSTIKTAEQFDIPLKTLEKWITAYNKDEHCFDEDVLYDDFHIISDSPINNNYDVNYDELSNDELKTLLIKKDIEITRLKKNYQVVKDGMGQKVFITFFKKNTK